MDRLRLDPDDPLASVIAWLAALARALGIELSAIVPELRLSRAGAAFVRRTLRCWRKQLDALVRAEAVAMARGMAANSSAPLRRRFAPPPPPHAGEEGTAAAPGDAEERFPSPLVGKGPGVRGTTATPSPLDAGVPRRPSPSPQPLSHKGRGAARLGDVGARPLSLPAAPPKRGSTIVAAPDDWISDEQDAALRRRHRALLAHLRDRSGLVRRLALKLARRRVRAKAALAALAGHRRFPHPPRALCIPRALATKPEPRPPDLASSVYG